MRKTKEQTIRRNIMEAANDETGKHVTLQLTTHGYTTEETRELEKRFEEFWTETKKLLKLEDLPENQVKAATLKRN